MRHTYAKTPAGKHGFIYKFVLKQKLRASNGRSFINGKAWVKLFIGCARACTLAPDEIAPRVAKLPPLNRRVRCST